MKLGITNWEDKNIRYDQTRNSIETIIKKIKLEIRKKENADIKLGYYESCGVSAFCTLMEGMGFLKESDYPSLPNGKTIQFDDWVMMYLNDPKNSFSTDVDQMDNRLFKNYVKLGLELFDCKADYVKRPSWNDIANHLKTGDGVQLCLIKPGHYIAAIAYDDQDDKIIFHDSWGKRAGLKNNGYFEELDKTGFDKNVKEYAVIYHKK